MCGYQKERAMQSEYQERIRLWIADALEGAPFPSFGDVVRALPGVYPSDVSRELDRLGVLQGLKAKKGVMVNRATTRPHRLPVPHPLDYDWRFTEESSEFLLKEILQAAGPSGKAILLGAPTLFRAACSTELSNRCVLLDRCAETVAAMAGINARIFGVDVVRDELPALEAQIVVADPPWYEEFAKAFLWASSNFVSLGGVVLLSTPPLGTRPGVDLEWQRTTEFAKQAGLELQEVQQSLRYQSPPFEINALRAAGHSEIDCHWRPGLLARFTKAGNAGIPRPDIADDHTAWMERSAFGVRIRLRNKTEIGSVNPTLSELVSGDILDSVSRRDLRRRDADVWTSGNRIFGCSDTCTLAYVIEAIAGGLRADTYVEERAKRKLDSTQRACVIQAAEQIAALISRELEEYVLAWEG
jgi:hypothetical protein